MLDAMLDFLGEVIAFHLGRLYLLALTLGRFNPKIGDRSQPLVSLFGGIFTIFLIVVMVVSINY